MVSSSELKKAPAGIKNKVRMMLPSSKYLLCCILYVRKYVGLVGRISEKFIYRANQILSYAFRPVISGWEWLK